MFMHVVVVKACQTTVAPRKGEPGAKSPSEVAVVLSPVKVSEPPTVNGTGTTLEQTSACAAAWKKGMVAAIATSNALYNGSILMIIRCDLGTAIYAVQG